MTLILGIETSCDETSAALVADGRLIHALVTASQIDIHQAYGGVFPEIASRQHVLAIVPVVEACMAQGGASWPDLDAVAVTQGPGLVGSLLVGVNAAKGIAAAAGKPLVGVNHLEAHLYANWLLDAPGGPCVAPGGPGGAPEASAEPPPAPEFPLLCLIVSGGHTALVYVREHHHYELLGQTIDDAAGEAYDKVARLLDLGYPGGPAIERAASGGNPAAYELPRAWLGDSLDFSFSGLKTAVLRLVQRHAGPDGPTSLRASRDSALPAQVAEELSIPDLAASFQQAVVDVLVDKTRRAAADRPVRGVLMAGGVAANKALRRAMTEGLGLPVRYPPLKFCTDNAAMVAAAGHFQFLRGDVAGWEMDVLPNLGLVRE